MTLSKLTPGMLVYEVRKTKMGNTTMKTVSRFLVEIISVDAASGSVVASWNGNPARTWYKKSWSKWLAKEPVLVPVGFGGHRLATKEELKAMKQP